MAFQNLYHHRRVAETASKPCLICYKASSHVLTTPDNKDFFYVCPGHLKDRSFALPVGEKKEDERAKKKKEELEAEIEKVRREYQEKMERRKKKGKDKGDKATKSEDNKDDKTKDAEEATERDEKIKELEKDASANSDDADGGPRIFALHKTMFQSRLSRHQNAQQAKKTQERFSNPNFFPNVPSGGL